MNVKTPQGPVINVGIIDRQSEVAGRLNGHFLIEGTGLLSGPFHAKIESSSVALFDEGHRRIISGSPIRLVSDQGSTFRLSGVTIGIQFHWERKEDQAFVGNLILRAREDGTLAAINEISLEDYLSSVISSEMSAEAPKEFLKAHAIMSRSWLLAALDQKTVLPGQTKITEKEGEFTRWYNREDHDIFDVCADDHCQRYQGITKIISKNAEEAVVETAGTVITYEGKVCDARYYKACGGLTDNYETAWEDTKIPYLTSVSDSPVPHEPITDEKKAALWVLSSPDAYCNTQDDALLATILPGFDRETAAFFRWRVEYSRKELEDILKERSGMDFGELEEIIPLQRGPSGRIFRLKITGSKQSVVVGKELEIRKWLSRSHLYSSAFIVSAERAASGNIERFIIDGAGWGHGVGLCQIGAAVMATKGFNARQILEHYFSGAELKKIY